MADSTAVAPTVGATLAQGTARLRAAGSGTARLDAELLLGAALGVDRARLVLDRDVVLDDAALATWEELLERRAAREPVAYILGSRDFRFLSLAVDRRVLIPRPETELLVEVGLGLPPGARVADVGTGSGAIALALASERPDLVLSGLDVSADALDVARVNGARLGPGVRWGQSDLLDDVDYDAVLANLPYVADGAVLAPEIARHEPPGALFAGPDGLDLVRQLIAQAGSRPAVSLLALEIGPEQAGQVAGLVAGAGFGAVEVLADLAGHDRVVVGRRA